MKKDENEMGNKKVTGRITEQNGILCCLMLIGFLNCLKSVAQQKITQQEWSASHFRHVSSQFHLLSGSSNILGQLRISADAPRMTFMAHRKGGDERGNKCFY